VTSDSISTGAPLSVLLVDDDPAADAVVQSLEGRGFEVRRLTPGRARRAARDARPTMVLVSVGGRNAGAKLAKALRADSATASIPLVALAPPRADWETLRWFDASLDKPIDTRLLLTVVAALARSP
jgi:DNA-binding response OmpR family regulator